MIEKLHIKYLALYTIVIVGITILITLLLTNKPPGYLQNKQNN